MKLTLLTLACAVALTIPGLAQPLLTEVVPIRVAELLRRPSNFVDLEGKTVRFRPAGRGRYTVRVVPLSWVRTSRQVLESRALRPPDLIDVFADPFSPTWRRRAYAGESTGIRLPFRFPFAGRRWARLHANTNGNLSFSAPEHAYWGERDPWADGTMRSIAAAVDSRAAAGLEAMIAVWWAPYEDAAISVDSTPRRVVITWNATRQEPDGWTGYRPRGANVFQVRLYPSGRVDLAYRRVSERDGIVGLFHGQGRRGRIVSVTDDLLGTPRAALWILSPRSSSTTAAP